MAAVLLACSRSRKFSHTLIHMNIREGTALIVIPVKAETASPIVCSDDNCAFMLLWYFCGVMTNDSPSFYTVKGMSVVVSLMARVDSDM